MSSHITLAEETGEHGVSEGVRRYHRAKDHAEWEPLMVWLGSHPDLATEFAKHIQAELNFHQEIAPLRIPKNRESSLVGGLELRDELGRGAMGVVYRAYDPVLKRDVAVKMIRSGDTLSPHELARFQFEAETVASLDHPNIVRVLASGEMHGEPYLVMPLMSGGSLATRLKEMKKTDTGALPEKEAAQIVRDIALGVHHAHQRGLIHRDLKPGNILLDKEGQPHVADFGLARRTDVSTSDSGVAGTVAYMAPEQATGDKHLTTAVDIHALGVILFELLTGSIPYGGGELGSIIRKLTDPTVQAPSVRKFRPDVSRDLEAVCMKCLEKDPAKRYTSARALANDLTCFLKDEPVSAQLPGFWDWLRQLARTRPEAGQHYSWQVTVWFGLIVLLTSGAIYGFVQADVPAVWVWVANFVSGAGMCVVLWWYMLRKFRQLPITERHSLIIAVGKILVYFTVTVAYVPLWHTASATAALGMYPALAAASGLGLFTLGSTNWSRFFPVGVGMIALVPILAWYPEVSPLVYGSTTAAVMWYWSAAKRSSFASHGPPTP
ncbi:MAG: protein kinase [Gemmataceae bacterium]